MIKSLFYKISPQIREKFFYFKFLKNPIKKIRQILEINKLYKKQEKEELNCRDVYLSLKKLILKTNDGYEFAKEFYKTKFSNINSNKIKENKPILICLVKDDLTRIQKFYDYYKKIGIDNFVFIDNMSTDGTFEYLSNLKEINLYRIEETYTTMRRQVWITKIMYYYGYNNWFLILDSDEFLTYTECEKYKIEDLIEWFEKKNIKRAKALMVDMYSNTTLFDVQNDEDMEKKYSYFDCSTYELEKNMKFELIKGGMRQRVFGKYENISPFLIKYPLIFFENGDLQYNSHFSFPFYKNFNSEIFLVLRHFKFMGNDLEKVKERVESKNYACGSKEYSAYLKAYKENPQLIAFYEKSQKYQDSNDINKIDIVSIIDWSNINGE